MARELTLQQMADTLHTGLRNYQKYESGDASPTLDGLVKIADLLNVSTDYLLGRDDYLKYLGVSVDMPLKTPPRHPNPKK
jgi:transcriptional regulator with XRE-family HTH domain